MKKERLECPASFDPELSSSLHFVSRQRRDVEGSDLGVEDRPKGKVEPLAGSRKASLSLKRK